MITLVAAAMALPWAMQQAALAQIGDYKSRGHGGRFSPIGRKGGHMAAVRKARKARRVRLSKRH